MHTVTIVRARVSYGPYDEAHALAFFKEGKILLNDLTRVDNGMSEIPFKEAVARCGWELPSQTKPWEVLGKIGLDSLFPIGKDGLKSLLRMPRTRLILIAGLAPLAALLLIRFFIYFQFALYVSVLWGMFFWSQFKTDTSSAKVGIRCFCVTAFFSTTVLLILHATNWFGTNLLNSADLMSESPSLFSRLVGFFFRAGLPEEICKAAVIFWIVRRPGAVLKPQDVVLYGLLSGFGFGINEGLNYQLGVNRASGDVDVAYVLNFLRLTSLPFLHACWCGIASYFIAYAAIAPMYRHGLWILAILIPAVIHTAYDAFCGVNCIVAFAFAALGVVLMLAYLEGAKSLRRKLM